MKTDDGREYARDSAKELLHQMSAHSVARVWEALAADLRFDSPQRRAALKKARAALEEAQAERFKLRQAAMKLNHLKRVLNAPLYVNDESRFRSAWLALWGVLRTEPLSK